MRRGGKKRGKVKKKEKTGKSGVGRKKKKKTENQKKKKAFLYRDAEEKTESPVQERLPVPKEVINHVLDVKDTLMCLAKFGYRRKLCAEWNILILFPKTSSCL